MRALAIAVGALALSFAVASLGAHRHATRDPSAEAVARQFVGTVVARRDLRLGWRLTAPSLRAHTTEAQWLAGNVPVQSYPVAAATATYVVELLRPRRALVEVVFYPRPGTRAQPGRFVVGLSRAGSRWRVSSYAGSVRGCRAHGERDPDPGRTMLWC